VDRSAGTSAPGPLTDLTERAGAWLPARLGEVETELERLVGGYGAALETDAAATLRAGGKRMRPLLVLLCAGPAGGAQAVRAALAVELVHMATLVHDDVLDDAPLRRGRPTVLASSGPARARAVGDFLFSRAFAQLAEPGSSHRISLLASASVALARGELAQRQDAFDVGVSADRYLLRCGLKTAALFECACLIGRPAEDPATPALRDFGHGIGLAFQLLDDVLDVTGPPERTGKARGTDLLDGTVTLPFILARGRDPLLAGVELRGLDPASAEALCDRIAAAGATEEVRALARERVDLAKRGLRAAGLEREDLDLFELVADGVVDRLS
jgi:geranylgeranyl pyrophosphate synthase